METDAPLTDPELLADWLHGGREPSFQALVSRYAPLVRMTALRSAAGDEVVAAEATQLTFILLARKARSLTGRSSLAGWLHLTAVLQVKNLLRQTRREIRKRLHLRASMETGSASDSNLSADHAAAWREIAPVLDQALAGLSARDREALLLRFYRSLSVRETAAALGIATAAAQKRLDRATIKLRARLVRLGLSNPGGPPVGTPLTGLSGASASLAAVLLAGLAADSQAAAVSGPATSLLASHALTHAAATGGAGVSTLLLKLTTLKTSSFLPPALALLLAAGWLIPRFTALAALRGENQSLDRGLADARTKAAEGSSSPAPKPNRLEAAMKAAQSLNWRELVALFTTKGDDPEIAMRKSLATQQILKKVGGMTRAELTDALDQIIALSQPMEDKQADKLLMEFAQLLLPPLLSQDARSTLEHFSPLLREGGRYDQFTWGLGRALGVWAKSDAAAASAWLDGQIAAGSFTSKTLSGENPARFWFESELMLVLLPSDPQAVAGRLEALDEAQRRQILGRAAGHFGESGRGQLIDLARTRLQPENGAQVIASMIPRARTVEDLPKTAAFMEKIEATPLERAACVSGAAETFIFGQTATTRDKMKNLAGARPWILAQAPEEADTITGKLLGNIVSFDGPSNFEELTELASAYDRESGGEEVLASFLESCGSSAGKASALKQAASLQDAARKATVLQRLESSSSSTSNSLK